MDDDDTLASTSLWIEAQVGDWSSGDGADLAVIPYVPESWVPGITRLFKGVLPIVPAILPIQLAVELVEAACRNGLIDGGSKGAA